MELRGIEVWDGEAALGASCVRWDGDAIEAVAPATGSALAGLCLIPGLIDTHVHMVAYAGRAPVDEQSWPLVTSWTEQMLHGAGQGLNALAVGITTVRDLGAFEPPVALRHAIDQGALPGPRVVAFGHVGMTAGHGDLIWPPDVAVRPETADGPDACRRMVRRYARMGADGIKIFTSGGVMSSGDKAEWRNQTRAEIEATVDEAHALGLRVAAHAHTRPGIQSALDAGVDSLEHATLITPEQAHQAREQGTVICPTLLALRRIAAGGGSIPPESVAKARQLAAARGDAMREAARAGAMFVQGTDGGRRAGRAHWAHPRRLRRRLPGRTRTSLAGPGHLRPRQHRGGRGARSGRGRRPARAAPVPGLSRDAHRQGRANHGRWPRSPQPSMGDWPHHRLILRRVTVVDGTLAPPGSSADVPIGRDDRRAGAHDEPRRAERGGARARRHGRGARPRCGRDRGRGRPDR